MGEDSDGERDVDGPDREDADGSTGDLQAGADVPVGDHDEDDDRPSHAEQPDPTAAESDSTDDPAPGDADEADDGAADESDNGAADETDADHAHGRTTDAQDTTADDEGEADQTDETVDAHETTEDDEGDADETDANEGGVEDEPDGDGAESSDEADDRLREHDDPAAPGVGPEPAAEVDEEFPEQDAAAGAASASTLPESDEAFPPGTGETDATGTETAAAGAESETTPLERKTGGGPQTDEELPLADHIEEMIKRLAVVVTVAGLVSLVVWPFGEEIINHLWYAVLPGTDIAAPHVYQPLELLITQFKVASLAGLILALPVFVYETYAFMRPGLYPHERRYYLAAVPTSLVLALLGVTFAYFVVLPAVFGYFYNYSQPVADIAFALSDTFNLILILLGYLALVFQIPLFIMLAIMMGITSRQWLEDRRLLFWGVFLGISFLFTPDPTGVAPILVAATMVGLFEATLALLRWTGR